MISRLSAQLVGALLSVRNPRFVKIPRMPCLSEVEKYPFQKSEKQQAKLHQFEPEGVTLTSSA